MSIDPKPVVADEIMSIEDIMAKQSRYLAGGLPENARAFDSLLTNFVARGVTLSTSSWFLVGQALSYMISSEIPEKLGYSSIEAWVNESLRPAIAESGGKDYGVSALMQWRNYYDVYESISEISPVAARNLLEVQASSGEYRSILSWITNTKEKLPGFGELGKDPEDLRRDLLEVVAEAIANISVEEVDINPEDLPKGKSICDITKKMQRTAINLMQESYQAAIAKYLAEESGDPGIQVGRYYEMTGAYEYIERETVVDKAGKETPTTKKIKFDFKGKNGEECRWVQVMSYDENAKEVMVRPWIYFGLNEEERTKKDMDGQGVLNKPVSIGKLNLKDESKVALTEEDLNHQQLAVSLPVVISHADWKILCKAYRTQEGALSDLQSQYLENLAAEQLAGMKKRTAEEEAI